MASTDLSKGATRKLARHAAALQYEALPPSKRRPQVSIDGKYSIPFTAAVMMVKGNVTLRDPAVLAMADRISYRAGASTTQSGSGSPEGSIGLTAVEIRTRDGRLLVKRPDGVPGDPRNPVGWPLLEKKFRDGVSFSAKPVPAKNVDRAIEMVRNLENVGNTADIIVLLA